MKLATVVFSSVLILSTAAMAEDGAPDFLSCKAKVTSVLGQTVESDLQPFQPSMGHRYLLGRVGAIQFDVHASNGYLNYYVRKPSGLSVGDFFYSDSKSIKFSASPEQGVVITCESL